MVGCAVGWGGVGYSWIRAVVPRSVMSCTHTHTHHHLQRLASMALPLLLRPAASQLRQRTAAVPLTPMLLAPTVVLQRRLIWLMLWPVRTVAQQHQWGPTQAQAAGRRTTAT